MDPSIQEKIEYVLKVIRTVDRIPQKFLSHIKGTDGLYEIRIMEICQDIKSPTAFSFVRNNSGRKPVWFD